MAFSRNKFFFEFEAWYQQYMPRLYNYVCFKVRDRSTAEDLTATICENALRNWHQYNSQIGSLNTWIFGIARNALRNHFRSQKTAPNLMSLMESLATSAADSLPEPSIEKTESLIQILANLDKLSERDQEIITLRYGAELSNQEIAAHLKLRANHVNVIIHRALERLRKFCLEEEERNHVSDN